MHEEDKVHHFLEKINCPNGEIKTEVNICRAHHSATFEDAVTYMSSAVARIFPNAQPSSGRYKKRGYRNISATGRGGRHGRGGGRGGRGRGGRGHGGRGRGNNNNKENGVDISDPLRWYSEAEMNKLSQETKKYILSHPDRQAAIEARKKRRNTSAANTNNTTSTQGTAISNEQERLCAAMITGVMNAQNNVEMLNNQQGNQQEMRYPVPGSRARSAASTNRSNVGNNNGGASVPGSLTFDANGNIIP